MRTSHHDEFRAYVVASRAELVHTATLLSGTRRAPPCDLLLQVIAGLQQDW